MRLIDADELIQAIHDEWDGAHSWDDDSGETLADEFAILVDSAPTVDAVPVVRCKDCKYAEWWDNFDPPIAQYFCEFMDANVELKDDDFCSKGERRDSDDTTTN